MSEKRYEEWEIQGSDGKRTWMVSDGALPASSQEIAQALCDQWHSYYPKLSYKPIGYNVIRNRIK